MAAFKLVIFHDTINKHFSFFDVSFSNYDFFFLHIDLWYIDLSVGDEIKKKSDSSIQVYWTDEKKVNFSQSPKNIFDR